MQSVTTSSGAGIVERFAEVVPTKEPLETASQCALPIFVMRESKSLETGRDVQLSLFACPPASGATANLPGIPRHVKSNDHSGSSRAKALHCRRWRPARTIATPSNCSLETTQAVAW